MDIYSLRLFLHLASSLHFRKTSEEVHLSPSAVSRTIKRLEEELGHPLFIRDRRSVHLTDTGAAFVKYAQEAVESWEGFRNSLLRDTQELSGELILYASVTATYGVLSDLFTRFRTLHPKVHLRLETGDSANALDKVLDGSADIAVVVRPANLPGNVQYLTVTTTPLVFIGPVVSCEVTTIIDQNPIPWQTTPIILAEQGLSRRRVEDWFRQRRIRPNVYAEVGGHEAILAMVRLGCGIGAVPEIVIDNSLFKDDVRKLEVDPSLPPYEVGLCVHKRKINSPVVNAFWKIAE
ncbi:HTH-type transcriptional activator IlvY [Candidatus Fermentibacteria bacterium]|nr:MAG: HTH-type transcriptional activator IlvY [Candidatus Fermentibacteria bacterium]